MIQDEKDRLLALFDHQGRWCQGLDASDKGGQAVHYDAEDAVAWDVVGGLCHLFGWKRACELFEPLCRHLAGRRHIHSPFQSQEIAAMAALFDFNDDDDTTYEMMIGRIRELPVWRGGRSSIQP